MAERLMARYPALERRDFRRYLLGMSCYSFGMRARGVILGWLIYDLTGSALSLGWFMGTWGVGALMFSLVGGAFSDRYGAKRVVVVFRVISTLALLAMFVLVATDTIAFWHILFFSFVNGVVSAFEYPARSALLTNLVSKDELTNGFGLSYTAMNLAAVVGPALVGWMTDQVGAAWALLVTGLIVCISVFAVLAIRRTEPTVEVSSRSGSMFRDVVVGIRYVITHPGLRSIELLLFIYVLMLVPYRDLLAAVSKDVLDAGPSGLGLLSSSLAVGALVGTILVSSFPNIRRRGLLMIVAAIVEGVGAALFARSPSLLLSMGLLAIGGLGRGFFIPYNNALLQSNADPRMRARVVGMNMLVWSFQPLGTIAMGAAADRIGPGMAMFAFASASAALLLVAGAAMPGLRRME
jgi:MFS family permease